MAARSVVALLSAADLRDVEELFLPEDSLGSQHHNDCSRYGQNYDAICSSSEDIVEDEPQDGVAAGETSRAYERNLQLVPLDAFAAESSLHTPGPRSDNGVVHSSIEWTSTIHGDILDSPASGPADKITALCLELASLHEDAAELETHLDRLVGLEQSASQRMATKLQVQSRRSRIGNSLRDVHGHVDELQRLMHRLKVQIPLVNTEMPISPASHGSNVARSGYSIFVKKIEEERQVAEQYRLKLEQSEQDHSELLAETREAREATEELFALLEVNERRTTKLEADLEASYASGGGRQCEVEHKMRGDLRTLASGVQSLRELHGREQTRSISLPRRADGTSRCFQDLEEVSMSDYRSSPSTCKSLPADLRKRQLAEQCRLGLQVETETLELASELASLQRLWEERYAELDGREDADGALKSCSILVSASSSKSDASIVLDELSTLRRFQDQHHGELMLLASENGNARVHVELHEQMQRQRELTFRLNDLFEMHGGEMQEFVNRPALLEEMEEHRKWASHFKINATELVQQLTERLEQQQERAEVLDVFAQTMTRDLANERSRFIDLSKQSALREEQMETSTRRMMDNFDKRMAMEMELQTLQAEEARREFLQEFEKQSDLMCQLELEMQQQEADIQLSEMRANMSVETLQEQLEQRSQEHAEVKLDLQKVLEEQGTSSLQQQLRDAREAPLEKGKEWIAEVHQLRHDLKRCEQDQSSSIAAIEHELHVVQENFKNFERISGMYGQQLKLAQEEQETSSLQQQLRDAREAPLEKGMEWIAEVHQLRHDLKSCEKDQSSSIAAIEHELHVVQENFKNFERISGMYGQQMKLAQDHNDENKEAECSYQLVCELELEVQQSESALDLAEMRANMTVDDLEERLEERSRDHAEVESHLQQVLEEARSLSIECKRLQHRVDESQEEMNNFVDNSAPPISKVDARSEGLIPYGSQGPIIEQPGLFVPSLQSRSPSNSSRVMDSDAPQHDVRLALSETREETPALMSNHAGENASNDPSNSSACEVDTDSCSKEIENLRAESDSLKKELLDLRSHAETVVAYDEELSQECARHALENSRLLEELQVHEEICTRVMAESSSDEAAILRDMLAAERVQAEYEQRCEQAIALDIKGIAEEFFEFRELQEVQSVECETIGSRMAITLENQERHEAEIHDELIEQHQFTIALQEELERRSSDPATQLKQELDEQQQHVASMELWVSSLTRELAIERQKGEGFKDQAGRSDDKDTANDSIECMHPSDMDDLKTVLNEHQMFALEMQAHVEAHASYLSTELMEKQENQEKRAIHMELELTSLADELATSKACAEAIGFAAELETHIQEQHAQAENLEDELDSMTAELAWIRRCNREANQCDHDESKEFEHRVIQEQQMKINEMQKDVVDLVKNLTISPVQLEDRLKQQNERTEGLEVGLSMLVEELLQARTILENCNEDRLEEVVMTIPIESASNPKVTMEEQMQRVVDLESEVASLGQQLSIERCFNEERCADLAEQKQVVIEFRDKVAFLEHQLTIERQRSNEEHGVALEEQRRRISELEDKVISLERQLTKERHSSDEKYRGEIEEQRRRVVESEDKIVSLEHQLTVERQRSEDELRMALKEQRTRVVAFEEKVVSLENQLTSERQHSDETHRAELQMLSERHDSAMKELERKLEAESKYASQREAVLSSEVEKAEAVARSLREQLDEQHRSNSQLSEEVANFPLRECAKTQQRHSVREEAEFRVQSNLNRYVDAQDSHRALGKIVNGTSQKISDELDWIGQGSSVKSSLRFILGRSPSHQSRCHQDAIGYRERKLLWAWWSMCCTTLYCAASPRLSCKSQSHEVNGRRNSVSIDDALRVCSLRMKIFQRFYSHDCLLRLVLFLLYLNTCNVVVQSVDKDRLCGTHGAQLNDFFALQSRHVMHFQIMLLLQRWRACAAHLHVANYRPVVAVSDVGVRRYAALQVVWQQWLHTVRALRMRSLFTDILFTHDSRRVIRDYFASWCNTFWTFKILRKCAAKSAECMTVGAQTCVEVAALFNALDCMLERLVTTRQQAFAERVSETLLYGSQSEMPSRAGALLLKSEQLDICYKCFSNWQSVAQVSSVEKAAIALARRAEEQVAERAVPSPSNELRTSRQEVSRNVIGVDTSLLEATQLSREYSKMFVAVAFSERLLRHRAIWMTCLLAWHHFARNSASRSQLSALVVELCAELHTQSEEAHRLRRKTAVMVNQMVATSALTDFNGSREQELQEEDAHASLAQTIQEGNDALGRELYEVLHVREQVTAVQKQAEDEMSNVAEMLHEKNKTIERQTLQIIQAREEIGALHEQAEETAKLTQTLCEQNDTLDKQSQEISQRLEKLSMIQEQLGLPSNVLRGGAFVLTLRIAKMCVSLTREIFERWKSMQLQTLIHKLPNLQWVHPREVSSRLPVRADLSKQRVYRAVLIPDSKALAPANTCAGNARETMQLGSRGSSAPLAVRSMDTE